MMIDIVKSLKELGVVVYPAEPNDAGLRYQVYDFDDQTTHYTRLVPSQTEFKHSFRLFAEYIVSITLSKNAVGRINWFFCWTDDKQLDDYDQYNRA